MDSGEEVMWSGRRSLLSYRSFPVSILLIALGASALVIGLVWLVGAAAILIGALILALDLIRVGSHKYLVTDRRLIEEHTFLGRQIREAMLDRVTDIELSQGLTGRLLNMGDLRLHTAGSPGSVVEFIGVRDPLRVRQIIIEARDRYLRRINTR